MGVFATSMLHEGRSEVQSLPRVGLFDH